MAEVNQTIIIKKINKVEGGAHGGAWKVAYADFVTAMMAFFLLMWLLSTSSEETLDGLADYFTPVFGVKDHAGIGFQGGEAPMEDGTKKDDLTPPGLVPGNVPQGPTPENPEKDAMIESDKDAKLFEKAEEAIKKAFESDPNLNELSDNIIVEQTPEGLKIEVIDSNKNEMFVPGGSELTEFGRRILDAMKVVIDKMPNFISLTGHTDAAPYLARKGYGNWELSSDRALSARRYLISKGMELERVAKIVGRADRELLLPAEPKSPNNRRITIILLRGSHLSMPESFIPAGRQELSVPKVSNPATRQDTVKDFQKRHLVPKAAPSTLSKPERNPAWNDPAFMNEGGDTLEKERAAPAPVEDKKP